MAAILAGRAGDAQAESTQAQPATFPTLCVAGETAYLNAHMANVVMRPDGGYRLAPTPNILSLCADALGEPFDRFVYRFGPVGHVEMERVATASRRFGVFRRSTTPHTGESVVSFISGPFVYCVSENGGQGSGIELTILRSGKVIRNLFSGTERGVDFEAGLVDLDFDAPQSPALVHVPRAGKFHTTCDPV